VHNYSLAHVRIVIPANNFRAFFSRVFLSRVHVHVARTAALLQPPSFLAGPFLPYTSVRSQP